MAVHARNVPGIEQVLEADEVLTLPGKRLMYAQEELLHAAGSFTSQGKSVLFIFSHVDRGSDLHFESVVKQFWIGKCNTRITALFETTE